MNLFEVMVIAIMLTLIIVLAMTVIIFKIKNTKFISVVAQLFLDKNALSQEIERLSFIINNRSDIDNDFIKFLSESKDSAYEYVEQVQKAIENLYNAMNSDNSDEIDKAYKKLIKFLPSKNMDAIE
jgi:biopolymer transport protein ExbB/TolQ